MAILYGYVHIWEQIIGAGSGIEEAVEFRRASLTGSGAVGSAGHLGCSGRVFESPFPDYGGVRLEDGDCKSLDRGWTPLSASIGS